MALNAPAEAEKVTEVEPAGMVTEAGTVSAVLLLDRVTEEPPAGAACLNVTVQALELAALRLVGEQESPASTGMPVPLRLRATDALVDELLAMFKVPLAAPAAVGSNCTVSVAAWLGLRVSGKVAPEIEKPAPVSVAELTVTAAVPVEESVIDCEEDVFTGILPKLRFDELTDNVGTAAFSCRTKACVVLPTLADSVTD